MVKITGPCYSMSARGWLGRYQYTKHGIVANPYPVALLNPYLMSSQYYSPMGWCYQMRRTWHGIVWSAIRPPVGPNRKTVPQQAWRGKFANAVTAWQAFTGLQKGVWNSYNFPRHCSGYNKFISAYLKDKPH